jgi:hypothetical protein
MEAREFLYKLSANRALVLVGQIIVLLICFSYFNYYYYFNIYPDKQVTENFNQTVCQINAKNLGRKGHLIHTYRANFLISYVYSGAQYSRWVSANGLDMAYTSNRAEQENLLAQFDQGGTYQCWVNPEEPNISVLMLRHHWLSTTPLMVPSIISFIVIYYMISNISAMLAARREKKREEKL